MGIILHIFTGFSLFRIFSGIFSKPCAKKHNGTMNNSAAWRLWTIPVFVND